MKINSSTIKVLFILILLFSLWACVQNDYRTEYQKEILYDGLLAPVDTVNSKTYLVINGDSIQKGDLINETTKWYDINGYNSMIVSIAYLGANTRVTTEHITRDNFSLRVANDLKIESEGTEPLVTLARLRIRKEGVEEWLFRHYLDPKKYLEDASTVVYESNKKILKKKDKSTDTLRIVEIDLFDSQGRKIANELYSMDLHKPCRSSYFYNEGGYMDSIILLYKNTNDSISNSLVKHKESFIYTFDDHGNPSIRLTYENDSLTYLTEYEYGYRVE